MSSEFRPDWKAYKLDELGFVGRGKSRHRPRNDRSLYGGSYPFFQTGDVKAANFYLKEYSQTYNEKGLAQSKLWNPGTLCITIAANIAETAILSIEGCFPDSIVGFIPDNSKADGHFIKYYLDTIKLRIQNVSHGATQDNLSLDKLALFDIVLPPLPTQHKIASILSAYDDLIENNTKRIKILEEMAQTIYNEWFVKFRFPGHENVKMVDSELGMIPEGWGVKTLGEICVQMQSGGTPSRKRDEFWDAGDINWYKTMELWDQFLFNSDEKITSVGLNGSSAKLYEPGTILMAIYGSPTVGRLGILTQQAACNQAALGMVANPAFSSQQYLFYTLYNLREYFNSIAQGAAQQNISKAKVAEALCVLPPKLMMNAFTNYIIPIWSLLQNLQSKNNTLRLTRDLLLPRLISGEIDVSELDINVEEITA